MSMIPTPRDVAVFIVGAVASAFVARAALNAWDKYKDGGKYTVPQDTHQDSVVLPAPWITH